MNSIIAKEEVNTGRQVEIDYAKALFLLAIFFIHAFQVCGGSNGGSSFVYQVIYSVSVMSGAVIYIFGMGIGSTYSKKDSRGMVRGGVKLIGYQFLNNIGYSLTLVLGMLLALVFENVDLKKGMELAGFYLIYLNIFFLAGGIYLLFALLKKVNISTKWYVILGVISAFLSPFLTQLKSGIPWLDVLVSPIIGGQMFVSFPIFPYISYALLGVSFGKLLRKVKDKNQFYKIVMGISGVVLACFTISVVSRFEQWADAYQYIAKGYTYPDFFRVWANIAGVCFLFSGFYFLRGQIKDCQKLHEKMLYTSKHISKYYAIHFCVYFFFFGVLGLVEQSFSVCCILCIVCMFITDWIVRYYVRRMGRL